jgi:putative CocE/NonD family hydrolase
MSVAFEHGVLTRDGVSLATRVTLPHRDFHGPALLLRTPYGRQQLGLDTRGLDERSIHDNGFALVHQDVRGRGASGGRFGYLPQEPDDGVDTLLWIGASEWSDRRVATVGSSYPGRAQLVLPPGAPHLVAMAPGMAGLASAESWRPEGHLAEGIAAMWIRAVARARLDLLRDSERSLVSNIIDTDDDRSVIEAATMAGHPVRHAAEPLSGYLSADAADEPATSRATPPRVPSLHITGWDDSQLLPTIRAWRQARVTGPDHHLLVGPWSHDVIDATIAEHHFAFLRFYLHGTGDRPAAATVFDRAAGAWRTDDASDGELPA